MTSRLYGKIRYEARRYRGALIWAPYNAPYMKGRLDGFIAERFLQEVLLVPNKMYETVLIDLNKSQRTVLRIGGTVYIELERGPRVDYTGESIEGIPVYVAGERVAVVSIPKNFQLSVEVIHLNKTVTDDGEEEWEKKWEILNRGIY